MVATMRVRDTLASAGGPRANEDRAGSAGTLAWVIDGATDLYDDTALPAESDVLWLVDTISQELRRAGLDQYHGNGPALLGHIAEQVSHQLTASAFPPDRVPPACSLAVVVDQGGTYEITRIGDATAIVTGNRLTILATDFFDKREAIGVAAQRAGVTSELVTAGKHQRRLYTMTSGDTESIFSGHPDRILLPRTIAQPWQGTEAVLLCSDGFARLVTDYDVYPDWAELVTDALSKGLAYQEKLLRSSETDPDRTWPGRFKNADDAAAILLTPAVTTP